jgi:hypothetical protein
MSRREPWPVEVCITEDGFSLCGSRLLPGGGCEIVKSWQPFAGGDAELRAEARRVAAVFGLLGPLEVRRVSAR